MNEHSKQFLTIREDIFKMNESDRTRLADLFGAMTAPKPNLSPEIIAVLQKIINLPVDDRHRLGIWFSKYVNRWGQIPVMASRLIKSK